MTARPLHQQYIIYRGSSGGGGGENPDPATYCPANGYELPPDPEVFCPINGYELPPDPAVFCPINGYIPDPEVLQPEFPMPDPTEESITFICNAATSNWIEQTLARNSIISGSSLRYYAIYDTNNNLLNTLSSPDSAMNFNFPTNDRYYIVKLYVVNASITGYYNNQSSVTPYNNCVEAAIFNTPNIIAINFKGNLNFKAIDFKCSLNNLSSLYEFVKDCIQFEYFKFPQYDFPMLERLDSTFEGSGIRKIDLRQINVPLLKYIDDIALNCKYLDEFHFMPTCNAIRAGGALKETIRLRKFTIWESAPNLGNYGVSSMAQMFQGSAIEGEIVIPNSQIITGVWEIFRRCPNIKKIKLEGNWPQLDYVPNAFSDCPLLEEVEMPSVIIATKSLGAIFSTLNTGLKIYKGPDIGYCNIPTANSPMESITGDMDNSAIPANYNPYISLNVGWRTTLHTFYCPKLRVAQFRMGGNSASYIFSLITTVEIDWANSSWTGTSAPHIQIGASLDANELNRIFTALPTVTGKTIDVRYCSGYATCDKTIATAKGWLVT